MEIILLSGGSGKRLWPLSNGTRSKQYLQFLQAPDGHKESMIQRVVRQISENVPTASVTIATSNSQLNSIESQLGRDIAIVTEPERRDTFPAIALSAAHLAWEKGCGRDEVVVAMPCDTYTENAYFDTICAMGHLVEQGVAELVLMGITPACPSTKFGYIVPSDKESSTYSGVLRFTEKPDEEHAKELLRQHAYWNGGVFAFRLGYMMDIVGHHVQADSFAELRKRYGELPKRSFDYEVVEKATSVAVVPYSGQWKDLGTWNAFCEELPESAIGHVVTGSDTQGTTIINELGLPIICEGISNAIIVAGHDGILVCGKESSEHIKPLVESFDHRPMFEERRWGTYQVLDDTQYASGEHSLTKSITLKPGKHISYQIHHHRSEVWTFVDGEGIFVLNGEVRKVKAGDTVIIPVEHFHTIKAITELTFIEVQSGHPLIEEDIERFEWDWGEE